MTVDISRQPMGNIIDAKALQSLMDSLHEVTPHAFAIIDLKGQVLAATGWQDVCTRFHRVHPQTLHNCIESDTALNLELKKGEIREYKCRNNMWDIVTPIFIGDRHLGNIFSGQYFYEDEHVDYDFFAAQADRYGFDKADYLEAVRKVPRWSREKIKNLMQFYSRLADIIANLSSGNLSLAAAMAEQKRIETVLKESQQDLKHAQEVSHTGNWRLDLQNNVLLWSDETYRIFGIPEGTPMSYEIFLSYIHPDDRQYVDRQWSAALKGDPYDIEHRILVGTCVKWVHERAVLEFDQQGNLISGFGTVQDITDRKQAEESLKSYAAELETANRELEAFSYSVSHDLRQPLRALDGFSQIVIEEYADKLDERGKDYLARVRKASQHMSRIIDDLINLSRVTRAEMRQEEVDLSEIAGAIVDNLKTGQPDRPVEIVIQDNIKVWGDRQLLTLALTNLLNNSFKFTLRKPLARIEFGAVSKNTETVYYVKDNGVGFDALYIDKLFRPFQRLHTSGEYPGDGIGLATVDRIIRRHGGRIWAESELDKGAAFFFTLRNTREPDI
ncbi:MAG: PocR ligand-binding domain-containing protein [Dehalococcoidales bacterium]|nr:PocR ligand-binding domain-containing protein [Dehalococcoidales bacterium]